ncbi:hypothetical protein HMPREF3121_08085 [Corynebacterium sp. HMSC11E11]|nr:hypothetical protein HMPREF3121_08085 [Corynebacterium sp. HMSC11E11]
MLIRVGAYADQHTLTRKPRYAHDDLEHDMADTAHTDPAHHDDEHRPGDQQHAKQEDGKQQDGTHHGDKHDDDAPFEFPELRYAHENADDPLCAAGLDRNARDLIIAAAACPESLADVEHHLATLHPRLGVTRTEGFAYCDLGIALERLPRLAELLEERPFLPMSHMKAIATAVYCLSDEHLDAFCDRLLRYLAPKRPNQALVGWRSLSKQLCHIVEVLEPAVRPPDPPDDSKPPDPAEDPAFSVDERSPNHTSFKVTLRADEGREVLDSLDAVARAHRCSRTDALLHLIRSKTRVDVVFNVFRAFDGDRAWMSGVGWLSAVATEEWTKRATHLRLSSNGSTDGYVPTDAMDAFIEGRDGICRFPGCSCPAHKADDDHVMPYDAEDPASGGPTNTANLHKLCRRHHNLKTARLWDVDAHPDGTEVWTSRDGKHTFTTMPEGPLAGFGRQTFDARLTRKTAVLREFNERRIAAEEEARRITEEALRVTDERLRADEEKYQELYGPNATHPDAHLSREEKLRKYPDVPPFGFLG